MINRFFYGFQSSSFPSFRPYQYQFDQFGDIFPSRFPNCPITSKLFLTEKGLSKLSQGRFNNRLKGEDIPLCARIMAVADVFDALVSKRQYKEKMSLEQAFAILLEERGVGLEPVLVDTFLELEDELRDVLPDKIELQH